MLIFIDPNDCHQVWQGGEGLLLSKILFNLTRYDWVIVKLLGVKTNI